MSTTIEFDIVSVTRAAEIIGCTNSRVRQLITDGTIRGQKLGVRVWAVSRVDAERVAKTPAKTGRPRKSPQN